MQALTLISLAVLIHLASRHACHELLNNESTASGMRQRRSRTKNERGDAEKRKKIYLRWRHRSSYLYAYVYGCLLMGFRNF